MTEKLFTYTALVRDSKLIYRNMTVKAASLKVATDIINALCERTGETVVCINSNCMMPL